MARIDNLNNFLTDVANAIREKKGVTAKILASDFDSAIRSIPSGGGGVELPDGCYIYAGIIDEDVSPINSAITIYTDVETIPVTMGEHGAFYFVAGECSVTLEDGQTATTVPVNGYIDTSSDPGFISGTVSSSAAISLNARTDDYGGTASRNGTSAAELVTNQYVRGRFYMTGANRVKINHIKGRIMFGRLKLD